MYTLVNCGSPGCATSARDTISVKIKDGDNGNFTEILNISARSIDDRWTNQKLIFTVRNDKIWVSFSQKDF